MIRSTLRAASYLARDGVHDTLAITGWAAGLVVGGLLDLIPAQAIRVCADRDYDRAVKMADALADAEAETEVLDPQWPACGSGPFEVQAYSGHDPRDPDCDFDPWDEVALDYDARCPICSRGAYPDPTASAVVDPSPAIPPVGGDDPAAPPSPVPGPAGSPNLVESIAEVLSTHGFSLPSPFDANVTCWCDHWRDSGRDLFQARTLHRKHVAELIAERIEKATPPAGFTPIDLVSAAQLIDAYCVRMEACGASMVRERELANRLFDAAHNANP